MVADVEVAVVHLQHICGQLLLLVLPQLLCLPWHAIFLNERHVNGRLDKHCRHDRYPIELAETRDQCQKS